MRHFAHRLALAIVFAAALGFNDEARLIHAADESKADHPLYILVARSLDRALDCATDLVQSGGVAVPQDKIAALLTIRNLVFSEFRNPDQLRKCFDSTRPVGAMVFYRPIDKPRKLDTGDAEETEAGILELFGLLKPSFNRMVYFFPIKDFPLFLAECKLQPVPGKQQCFRKPGGQEVFLRQIHDYVIMGDAELIERCPDPQSVAQSLLGTNDLVVSLQKKGLPDDVRISLVNGVQAAFEASMERQDDVEDRDHNVNLAIGELERRLLNLVLLHVDEFNLGLRIDRGKKLIVADLALVAEPNGRMAKFAAELTPKQSVFASLWNPDGDSSLWISLAIPDRHGKIISTLFSEYADALTEGEEEGEIFKKGIPEVVKMVNAGHFEFIMTEQGDFNTGSSMFAFKHPSGRDFPKTFEEILRLADSEVPSEKPYEFGAGFVKEWPAHRMPGRFLATKMLTDGNDTLPEGETWVVASPHALLIAANFDADNQQMPTLLHSAVELAAQNGKPTGKGGENALFRLSYHTRDWKESGIPEFLMPQIDPDEEQREVMAKFFQEKPERIQIEIRSFERGFRMTMQFEEAFRAVAGLYISNQLTLVKKTEP